MGKIAFFDDAGDFYSTFSIVFQRIEIRTIGSDTNTMYKDSTMLFYIHNYFAIASYSTAVFNPLHFM